MTPAAESQSLICFNTRIRVGCDRSLVNPYKHWVTECNTANPVKIHDIFFNYRLINLHVVSGTALAIANLPRISVELQVSDSAYF